MVEIAKMFIPIGVVILQIVGIWILIELIAGRILKRQSALLQWLGRNAVVLGFLATLAAVSGSLFYSDVIGFEPCYLCWWQRVFMYPQLVLFAIALWSQRSHRYERNDRDGNVFDYSMPLSIIGILISLYHNFLPYFERVGLGCGTTGPSCTKLYVLAFGYITIPMMSLTIFAILILLAVANKIYEK